MTKQNNCPLRGEVRDKQDFNKIEKNRLLLDVSSQSRLQQLSTGETGI